MTTDLNAQLRPLYDYEALLSEITLAIKKGEKRALRDLGTILDIPEYRSACIKILKENTLFLEHELNITESINREKFNEFYYKYENDIKFSSIAHTFFITPLKKHPVKFELTPFEDNISFDQSAKMRSLSDQLMLALSKNNYSAAITKIINIGDINSTEAFDWLIDFSQHKAIQKAKQGAQEGLVQALFSQLSKDKREKSLKTMLDLLNKGFLSPQRASKYLTKLTNVSFMGSKSDQGMYSFYNNLLDSLTTLEAVRHFGYKQYFNFGLDFFEHPVDYYGQILAQSSEYPWIEMNAVKDLIKIGHPRALLYLSGNIFKDRLAEDDYFDEKNELIFSGIEKMTQVKIGLLNGAGEQVVEYSNAEFEFKKNYFIYWAGNYDEYIWEDNQNIFINKNETAEKVQSYEKLFRRLSSKTDSIAVAAFTKLCKGDPIQISELANKYRQLLRNYNSKLPSFKYNFLESMTRLTEFCRKNNLQFEPQGTLLKDLERLEQSLNPEERFKLENKVANQLNFKNITALEYWACLQEPNIEFNFSMGRIVDRFYSKNWQELIGDDQKTRTYLKKSYLFENIGIVGNCNAYLRKFDLTDSDLTDKLATMLQVEGDSEIANQISQLIDSEIAVEESFNLTGFIENPSLYGSRDIKLLPAPNNEENIQLARIIAETDDIEALKKVFFYLRLNANLNMIPSLMKHVGDERVLGMKQGVEVTIGENIIPIFEKIYNHKFESTEGEIYNRSDWTSLWQKDSLRYKSWGIGFLEQRLIQLEEQDTVKIKAINSITGSQYYDPILKNRCLDLLGKVYPIRDLRKFSIEPALDVATDLKFFEGFRFDYKLLDDISQLFEVKNPELMLKYLIHQSQDYSVENLGRFYNKLFQFSWFQSYLNASTSKPQLAQNISRTLVEYLDQSEYISEFEEQNTNLHIAQLNNIGKPLIDRLTSAVLNELEEGSKFKIQQELISGVAYEDLGTIVNYIDQLSSSPGNDPLEFLRKDFGLPIFKIEDSKGFIKDHKNLSQLEFYLKYLEKFGVEITNGKNLDFDKIYDILEFEIVSPFVGDGGQKRDHFVYGVIKVLELTYNTTLGFHEKLNENQSFYTFSASKRANAWMDYLKQNGLIKLNATRAPSFNLATETQLN